MMKSGFTLPELLVSLGLVAVISAVIIPTVNDKLPDQDKIKVLKTYKVLSQINQDILDDRGLYFPGDSADGSSCDGLACDGKPLSPDYSDDKFSGINKYFNIISTKLETKSIDSANKKLVTVDDVEWTITNADSKSYNLQIDVDSDANSKNCVYGDQDCSQPDRFKFVIDKKGKLTGDDFLTKAYILNPYKMNDRAADYAKAKTLSSQKLIELPDTQEEE